MNKILILILLFFTRCFSEELENLFANNSTCIPLFTTENNVKETLVKLIEEEKKSIKIAMYFLTDSLIAQALADAFNRGIKVLVITDHSNTKNNKYSKINKLYKNNVPIFVYGGNGTASTQEGIMHHKFLVFKNNFQEKTIVWTGSFNCTYSAQKKNIENAIIISSKQVAKIYSKHFKELKKLCKPYKPPKKFNNEDTRFYNSRWYKQLCISIPNIEAFDYQSISK